MHFIDEDTSLRMFTERDAEELYMLTMASKEHLQEWLGWLHPMYYIEDTVKHIQRTLQNFANNGGYPTSFAILYQNRIVGTIGFNHIHRQHRSADIGYWLGTHDQGKGTMTKAFAFILSYGFIELKLNRIEVRVAENNQRSRLIPERFHFVQEGKIRQAEWLYDHFVDHIVYGMLADEWKNNNKAFMEI